MTSYHPGVGDRRAWQYYLLGGALLRVVPGYEVATEQCLMARGEFAGRWRKSHHFLEERSRGTVYDEFVPIGPSRAAEVFASRTHVAEFEPSVPPETQAWVDSVEARAAAVNRMRTEATLTAAEVTTVLATLLTGDVELHADWLADKTHARFDGPATGWPIDQIVHLTEAMRATGATEVWIVPCADEPSVRAAPRADEPAVRAAVSVAGLRTVAAMRVPRPYLLAAPDLSWAILEGLDGDERGRVAGPAEFVDAVLTAVNPPESPLIWFARWLGERPEFEPLYVEHLQTHQQERPDMFLARLATWTDQRLRADPDDWTPHHLLRLLTDARRDRAAEVRELIDTAFLATLPADSPAHAALTAHDPTPPTN